LFQDKAQRRRAAQHTRPYVSSADKLQRSIETKDAFLEVSMVDSHCHLDRLDLTAYNGDISGAIESAGRAGVTHMLCVCITLENFPGVLNLARRFDNVYASVGVHPTEQDCIEPTVEKLVELARDPRVVAIGETGLDYFHCKGDLTWQQLIQGFRHRVL
jgi:TatD DNase family protein